jgi:hypothetical protein
MTQKRTGTTGTARGDLPGRGKPAKADVNEHTRAKPGQQAPSGPTRPGPNTPYPAKGRTQSSAPMRDSRAGVRDLASGGTGQSLFQRADARNRKLGQRNRPTA